MCIGEHQWASGIRKPSWSVKQTTVVFYGDYSARGQRTIQVRHQAGPVSGPWLQNHVISSILGQHGGVKRKRKRKRRSAVETWTMHGVINNVEALWRSNVALSATAALAIVLNVAASLVVYFCRRKSNNKSVRKFLLALTLEALAVGILPGTMYAVTQVMGWAWVKQVCGGLTWSFATLSLLQALTCTTLLADRLYAARWRSRYRNRVNQAQIRYHIMVCAMLCASLAAVPTFIRSVERYHCPFLLYDFTFGYGAFVCVVLIFLTMATATCLALLFRIMRKVDRDGLRTGIVFLQKNKRSSLPHQHQRRDFAPNMADSEGLSDGSSAEKVGLAEKLSSLQEGADSWNRRRTPRGKTEEVRQCTDQWKLLVAIATIDYAIFHLPLLVSTCYDLWHEKQFPVCYYVSTYTSADCSRIWPRKLLNEAMSINTKSLTFIKKQTWIIHTQKTYYLLRTTLLCFLFYN